MGLSPSSAFRLRRRPGGEAFAQAWDQALTLATNRLVALAFHRAVNGSVKEVWERGEKVRVERYHNDRLLMFLLRYYDPRRFGALSGPLPFDAPDRPAQAAEALPTLLDALRDSDEAAEPHIQPVEMAVVPTP